MVCLSWKKPIEMDDDQGHPHFRKPPYNPLQLLEGVHYTFGMVINPWNQDLNIPIVRVPIVKRMTIPKIPDFDQLEVQFQGTMWIDFTIVRGDYDGLWRFRRFPEMGILPNPFLDGFPLLTIHFRHPHLRKPPYLPSYGVSEVHLLVVAIVISVPTGVVSRYISKNPH